MFTRPPAWHGRGVANTSAPSEASQSLLVHRLQGSPLFEELTLEQVDAVLEIAKIEAFSEPGEAIVTEGEVADAFYLILDGQVEVYKRSTSSQEEVHVATLSEGSHFGETSLLHQGRRTATVRAQQPVSLLIVDSSAVRKQREAHPWLIGFLLELVAESSSRLDRRSERLVASLEAELDTAKLRLETTRQLMYILVLMALYSIGLAANEAFRDDPMVAKLSDLGLFLGFGVALFALVKRSALPLSFFGVKAPDNWKRELLETLGATAVFLAVVSAAKYALIVSIPSLSHLHVFELSTFDGQKLLLMTAYIVLVPVQEMCIRGVLQGSIADALGDASSSRWKAIIPSNALFAAVHAHMSIYFALGVFLPGLFWGWLYSRQTSLLGVCISHAIIGIFTIDVLGLKTVLM